MRILKSIALAAIALNLGGCAVTSGINFRGVVDPSKVEGYHSNRAMMAPAGNYTYEEQKAIDQNGVLAFYGFTDNSFKPQADYKPRPYVKMEHTKPRTIDAKAPWAPNWAVNR